MAADRPEIPDYLDELYREAATLVDHAREAAELYSRRESPPRPRWS